MATDLPSPKLVSAAALMQMGLLPFSLRTLRALQKKRLVPFYKIGRLVLFDPDETMAALKASCHVHAKPAHKGASRIIALSS